ncbi:Uncharacterized protein BC141101_01402 [Bacillus toyonensis]|uniref:hypothetical protein n=1 Tax=Bacillus TaxID=1386 RepID=UPI0001A0C83F|nr:hypothetical protein [Bacillus toyonensis]EEL40753.1 hypothetical protein bcere0020_18870 [Bacillus cereus Rock3-29]EJR61548.1 hypothetical protein IIO_03001 [Bacillus cereus VD115]KAB0448947.1 hypothetical protein CH334_11205 [Lysinibacillus sp. VIA-II-2016]EJV46183.1 hypothetical protein IEA_03418 [Bacillus toyonensis]EJV93690.1 hypothetical protein IGI_03408 [Bacillus toyonensis]
MGEHVKNHGGKGTKQKYKSEEAKQNSLANLKKNGEYGKNSVKHGIYSAKFRESWTLEEQAYYDDFMSHYQSEYELSKMDEDMLDRYLVAMIKTRRVDSMGMKYAINRPVSMLNFDQEAIRMAQELGLSRRYRLSKDNAKNKTEVDLSVFFDGMNDKQ